MLRHEIVSLPSASFLTVLRRELANRKPAARAVAVLADPVFDVLDQRVKKLSMKAGPQGAKSKTSTVRAFASATLSSSPFEERDLTRSVSDVGITTAMGKARSASEGIAGRDPVPRLPYSRQEAMELMSLLPEQQLRVALDFDASRHTATGAELSEYRVVHFATHGLLNSNHPELSGLLLSMVDSKGRVLDGFLRLRDIYNLRLPADLVVLSACQTGLGKVIKGEGLIGLTRGFMYAGAARVLSSLWKVDDRATAELMKHFYRSLFGTPPQSPAAALRTAQLTLAREKRWEDPYFWAGFVLHGEWQ